MLHLILFLVFAAICVAGAINLLIQRHPISSALSLVVVMASLAAEYLLLGAEFVAAVQVIVYAGAVMVLFVFVIMLYTASYAAMNVGAFAIVSHLANRDERYVTLEDYSGMGRRSPMLAGIFTIFLISLIGIPVTGGFFAKFYVFSAALQSGLVWLTIIGVINSAIGAYYYLKIIVVMYMKEPREEVPVLPVSPSLGAALALCLIATIYLGVLPGPVLDYTQRSAKNLQLPPVDRMAAVATLHQ